MRRHPEALEVELEPPIIVVGLPRSGTTHLVNLLAVDSRFRSMPWWEVAEPTPVLGDGPGRDGIDPRYLRCLATWELTNETAPLTALMHDRPPWSIEEDCELVDLDLCAYTLEWHARVPSWRDYYLQLDQRPHYAFLRRELQVLSYLRGPNRWVLKTPQHLEQLGPLLETFPDATIAFTLRDPVAVLQSAITMLAYGDRLRRVRIEPTSWPRTGSTGSNGCLRAAVRDAHLIPAGQRVDVEFGEFMADDLAMAAKILDVAGLELTDRCAAGSRPTWPATHGARTAASSTTCGTTSVSSPPHCTNGSPSTTRPFPRSARRCADARHPPRAPRCGRHRAATGTPAVALGDDIWMSPGLSNSYLLPTDDGRLIINTGMGFEGPLHQRAYADVDDGPTRAIILTQGHYDHVGGVDVLRDDDTEVVAQANFETWRSDNERLETFRARNAAFAWMDAIVAAMEYAGSLGVGRDRTGPSRAHDDVRRPPRAGHRRAPAGAAVRCRAARPPTRSSIWLPESRTAFTGNTFGPLFGHVPNLVTIRGDRYRDALAYVSSVERVLDVAARPADHRALRSDRRRRPHRGEVPALRDAMLWVHDRTVDGMNRGDDVHRLMREITAPEHLDVGEGYGTTSWNVRAIWENYAGWFHHRSTTELYAVPATAIAGDRRGRRRCRRPGCRGPAHLDAGRPVEALHLTDLVLAVEPRHAGRRAVAAEASRALLDASANFWEAAWLRRSIEKLEAGGEPGALRLPRRLGARHRRHQRDRPRRSPTAFAAAGAVRHGHRYPWRRRGLRHRPPRLLVPAGGDDRPALDRRLVGSLDSLDVLVNNAGANFPGGRDEWEPDTFADRDGPEPQRPDAAHDRLPRPAGGQRPRRRGIVISMVSMAAFRSIPLVPGYGSAKAGLVALTRNLARQWVTRRDPGERGRPGGHRDPDDRTARAVARAARRRAGAHPDGALRHPRRGRAGGAVPGQLGAPATSPARPWSSTAATSV